MEQPQPQPPEQPPVSDDAEPAAGDITVSDDAEPAAGDITQFPSAEAQAAATTVPPYRELTAGSVRRFLETLPDEEMVQLSEGILRHGNRTL